MFVSIINHSFRRAREVIIEDLDMFSLMFTKFLRWIGVTKPSESEIQEERDSQMRSKYLDLIEIFSQRIDQLLKATTRVC
ncbi:unnamed protein product [Rotaria sordida]|uniref:Uncharacterized protein n=1 Tax=Rotaria sordida TaxID=392033 RepID=A0A814LN63_9BILA|nr:unnamed protein product [Rotaria sordida]CAF1067340.1 unnamed protein product [Rotaria sordida]